MGVMAICVLVFTVFCIVCTVFFVLFRLCILFSFVLSVLVQGLLPPSDSSTAVSSSSSSSSSNSNNNNHCLLKCITVQSGTQVSKCRKNFLLPSTS